MSSTKNILPIFETFNTPGPIQVLSVYLIEVRVVYNCFVTILTFGEVRPQLSYWKQNKYLEYKSCYLLYGPEICTVKVQIETEEKPVMLGYNVIDEKPEEKYLRDIFSREGVAESVEATVNKKDSQSESFNL